MAEGRQVPGGREDQGTASARQILALTVYTAVRKLGLTVDTVFVFSDTLRYAISAWLLLLRLRLTFTRVLQGPLGSKRRQSFKLHLSYGVQGGEGRLFIFFCFY